MATDWAETATTSSLDRLADLLFEYGTRGIGPWQSAEQMAQLYAQDASYPTLDARVKALIRNEATKNFATGMLTGMGGLRFLPASISAGLLASWILQARLAATIACLHGHSVRDEQVKTLVLLALLGSSARDALNDLGLKVADRSLRRILEQLGRQGSGRLHHQVANRLLRKTGQRGAFATGKALPLIGAVIGGGVDAAGCWAVGRAAHAMFQPAS